MPGPNVNEKKSPWDLFEELRWITLGAAWLFQDQAVFFEEEGDTWRVPTSFRGRRDNYALELVCFRCGCIFSTAILRFSTPQQ